MENFEDEHGTSRVTGFKLYNLSWRSDDLRDENTHVHDGLRMVWDGDNPPGVGAP